MNPPKWLQQRGLRRIIPPAADACAAASCGVGVALMALTIKPVPVLLLGFLGWWVALVWASYLLFGSLATAVGCLLRLHRGTRVRVWSYGLEYLGWPSIAWCALIFAVAAAIELGALSSMLTIGFAGFVVFSCCGQWWRLREAKRLAAVAVAHTGGRP